MIQILNSHCAICLIHNDFGDIFAPAVRAFCYFPKLSCVKLENDFEDYENQCLYKD